MNPPSKLVAATKRLLGLLLAAFILILMIRWFEHHQVYFPTAAHWTSPDELDCSWEDVYFEAVDGVRLNAWWMRPSDGESKSSKVVLVCHGNGGHGPTAEKYRSLMPCRNERNKLFKGNRNGADRAGCEIALCPGKLLTGIEDDQCIHGDGAAS